MTPPKSKKVSNGGKGDSGKRVTAKKNAAPKANSRSKSAKASGAKKTAEVADATVQLDTKLGIQQIGDLTDQLSGLLKSKGRMTIDAGKVESVDTAALQVLVAFANSARAQSRDLDWVGAESCLLEFSALLGLDASLGMTAVAEEEELCPVF